VLGVDGRCVAVLDLGGAAGHYEAIWDGRDASGRALSPGLYFVLITLAEKTQVCRVMLLR
jgi:hypothetical protein